MASVTHAATHDARLSMLAARCGVSPVSGIAGVSSRGISGGPIWPPDRVPASGRNA